MRIPIARTLLAAAALVALAGAAPAAGAPLAGLVIGTDPALSAAAIDQQLDRAKALGVKAVRGEVDWDALEPVAAGQRDPAYVAFVDHFVDGARARGLKVVMLVLGTPCWASSAPADVLARCGEDGFRGDEATLYPPVDPAGYGTAVGYLAGRYASSLAAIELWNEPDHASEDYFKGPDKPRHYVELVRAAYPKAKAAAPRVPVLAGALVGADGRFLKALYAEGMKGHYDGLAVHYYDLVLASLRSIRAVQRAAGDTKPLWLTEFGWTSCYPRSKTQQGHSCVSTATQATDLVDVYRALRTTTWVKAAVVYNVQDTLQYQFGVVDRQGRLKPAYTALRNALRAPGRVRAPAVRLARSGGAVVARGSGPAGDNLELRAYVAGRLRYRAILKLDRANRFSVRLPSQLGTSSLRVRVLQYWSGRAASATI
jgi:hypothetical protein